MDTNNRSNDNIIRDIRNFLKGFRVTFGYIFKKKVTYQYPEKRRKLYRRFHGRHWLARHEDGLEKCVGCSLCAVACPAEAIYVEAGENTEKARYSKGERYAMVYEINMIRCIFCGLCVEACPTFALNMCPEYELSEYDRDRLIYTKEMLLEKEPGEMDKKYPWD